MPASPCLYFLIAKLSHLGQSLICTVWQVSLGNPDWSQTYCKAQAGIEPTVTLLQSPRTEGTGMHCHTWLATMRSVNKHPNTSRRHTQDLHLATKQGLSKVAMKQADEGR